MSLPTGNMEVIKHDPKYETEWKESVKDLQQHLNVYDHVKATGDAEAREAAAENIASSMDTLVDKHTDRNVKRQWKNVKRHWQKNTGNRNLSHGEAGFEDEIQRLEDRDKVIANINKGLKVILTTPFALVGAVLASVAAILEGFGFILMGLGNLARIGKHRTIRA